MIPPTLLVKFPAKACLRSAFGLFAALGCHAAVFTVDNTQNSGSVFLQACTSAPNDCSFIGAVTAANATLAEDTIAFNIPVTEDAGCVSATGACQIRLPSSVLNFTQPIIIDGYTQPGATPNTLSGDGLGLNMQLKIELLRAQTNVQNGLYFQGSAKLTGIAFNVDVFSLQAALLRASPAQLSDTTQMLLLEGNIFGASAAGVSNNQVTGVKWFEVESGQMVFPQVPSRIIRVGGLLPAQRNWILSGDPALAYKGALQVGQTQTFSVQGNLFGTTKNGLAAINGGINAFRWIEMAFSGNPAIVVGGSAAEARNVFVRPATNAIEQQNAGVGATTTKVLGNYFGLGADGVTPLTLPFDPQRAGEAILAMKRTQIGGALPGEANQFVGNYVGSVILDPATSSVRENVFLANTTFGIIRRAPISNTPDPNSPNLNAYAPGVSSVNFSYDINRTVAQTSYPLTVLFYKAGLGNNPSQLIGSDTYTAINATLTKTVTFPIPSGVTLDSNDVVIASSYASGDLGSSEFSRYISLLTFVGNAPAFEGQLTPIRVRMQAIGPFRPRGTVTISDTLLTSSGVRRCTATLMPTASPLIAEAECNLAIRGFAGTTMLLYAQYESDFDNFRNESYGQPTATRNISIVAPQVDKIFCDGFESPLRCTP